jgi:PAS domain S-box-containing protein
VGEKKRIVFLVIIMAGVAVGVGGMMLFALYDASFEQQRERLIETAQSQARIIEAVARFDAEHSIPDVPGGAFSATIGQIRDAHKGFKGFGETGEFTLAKREQDQIAFLLSHRHDDLEDPRPVPFKSKLAEPMRRALSGESGTVVGLDYRGVRVLAAYEPVAELNLGIVAKIDLAEVRAPFIKAGLLAAWGGAILFFVSTVMFSRIGNPIIQRLEESERKYRGIFESAVDMLFLIDSEGAILDANPAACSAHGFSREELLGRAIKEIVSPEGRSLVDSATEMLGTGSTVSVEATHVRKDGSTFNVEVRLSPTLHLAQKAALAVVRDTTERKQAEEALQKSEEKYRSLFDYANDSIFIINPADLCFLDVNKNAVDRSGYTREELLQMKVGDLYTPLTAERNEKLVGELQEKGCITFEHAHRHKNGMEIPVEISSRFVEYGGQRVLQSLVRNISERKQAEDQLRFQAQLLDNVRESIVGTDLEGNVIYWGKGAEALYGYSAADVLGNPITFIVEPQEEEEEKERMRQVLEEGVWSGRYVQRRKDGSSFWAEAVILLAKDQNGRPFGMIGIDRDITGPKEAEENLRDSEARYRQLSESLEVTVRQKVAELRQAESLAAIGEMVSIVAHEVRNPLQNIQMGVDAMQVEIGEDEEKQGILEEINYGVDNLNRIIIELLEYAKPVKLKPTVANLREIVANALKTLDHKLTGINIHIDLEHEGREIEIDTPKFNSAFVNLLSNAAEAMPSGGELSILSRFQDDHGASLLKLTITDSGGGIDKEHLDRVHQPFFTTKTKGTGLGIPACKKIIEAHNGSLTIKSEVNKGTTVDIEIPVTMS